MKWLVLIACGLLAAFRIQTATAEEPAWAIRVLNSTEVDLSGTIGKGIGQDFGKVVDAHPTLSIVHVHVNVGGGGSVREALLLAEIIALRKMDTYVPQNCGGSCTIVVAAGVHRYLRDRAELGYANYDVPGKGPLDAATWQSLYKTPFPPEFVAQASAARLDDIWVPDLQELLAAGAVTEIVDGTQFAASWAPTDRAGTERVLLENRAFQIIKARDPDQFAALVEKLHAAVAGGMPVEQVRIVGQTWLGGMASKYIPYADDQSVNAFIALMLEEAESLAAKDQAACHAALGGGATPGAGRAAGLIPPDLREREPNVLAAIFESADPARPLPDEARTDALLEEVIVRMGPDGALFDQLSDPNISPEIGCRVSLSVYRSTLSMPPEDSAAVFKSWYLP